MTHDGFRRHGGTRTAAEAVVRVQLLLLGPLLLALLAAVLVRRGLWLLLAWPAAFALVLHAGLIARTGLREWGRAAGDALVVGAVALLLGLAVGPALGLYRTVTVLSGSMRPTFSPGDVIVDTPAASSSLRSGDVITYQIPVGDRAVESHRVVKILRGGREPIVQTKGDANNTLDPWTAQLHGGTIWRYRLRIPYAGLAILALRDPLVHRLLVLVAPALLALLLLARVWLPARPVPHAHVEA